MSDDDLKRLFDATAKQPTPTQLTRMTARAVDARPARRMSLWWPALSATMAAVVAVAVALSITPPDQTPAPEPVTSDAELELAAGTYLDVGFTLEEDDTAFAWFDGGDEEYRE